MNLELLPRRLFFAACICMAAFVVLPLAVARGQVDLSLAGCAERADWAAFERGLDDDDVGAAQPDGTTALHWAAFHGHAGAASRLVKAGADVDSLNFYDVSPLSLAAERGHASVVRQLINTKANVESKRLGGERPLMLACRNGDLETVEMLIKAGAKLDAKEARGQTALMWAAAAGNVEPVDALIKAGADIDHRLEKSGFTAFLFAAREGRSEVVMRFLAADVDPDSEIKTKRKGGRHARNGMSAMMLAIESGHLELAVALVEQGADPNDQRSGFTPLHAISWVRKTKLGDDPEGDPPPRITGNLTTEQFVRQMVELGADVNQAIEKAKKPGKAKLNPRGATPFLYAARTADVPLMRLLLELGADPTVANADGCNALMAAAGIGVIAVGEEPGTEDEVCESIRMLHELGVDVNTVDKNGETAVHGAAYRNFPLVVTLLGELGADPEIWNTKNRHGWTPRDIATGERPGSLKPSPETIRAIEELLR